MEIRNCKKCGRIYNYVVGPNLCPRCTQEMNDKFQEVKQYIYDNPGVGVAQVSEEMDVPVAQIKQWIREERLQFAEGSVTDIFCERCGKQILSGKYCENCKTGMVRDLASAYKPEVKQKEKNASARMRYLR